MIFFSLISYLKIYQKYLGFKLYIVFMSILTASLFEGIGVLLLIPVFTGLLTPNHSQNNLSDELWDKLTFIGFEISLPVFVLAAFLFFLFKGVCLFGALILDAKFRSELSKTLRLSVLGAFKNANRTEIEKFGEETYLNAVSELTTRSVSALNSLSQFVAQLSSTIIYFGLSAFVSFKFTLLI